MLIFKDRSTFYNRVRNMPPTHTQNPTFSGWLQNILLLSRFCAIKSATKLSMFILYHPQMIFKNLYFQVCGVIILAISLWMYTNDDIKEYLTIIEYDRSNPYFDAALIVLILVGVFIFLVGFLGCCGAWKENSCLLWLVSTIMKLIDYF